MKAYIKPGDLECLEEVATWQIDKLQNEPFFRLDCRVSEVLDLWVEN